MTLVKCSECAKQISDKATACPNCGNPRISKNTPQEVSVKDVELTNKKLKINIIIDTILLIVGFTLFFYALIKHSRGLSDILGLIGVLLVFVGFVKGLIDKFLIWWNHR